MHYPAAPHADALPSESESPHSLASDAPSTYSDDAPPQRQQQQVSVQMDDSPLPSTPISRTADRNPDTAFVSSDDNNNNNSDHVSASASDSSSIIHPPPLSLPLSSSSLSSSSSSPFPPPSRSSEAISYQQEPPPSYPRVHINIEGSHPTEQGKDTMLVQDFFQTKGSHPQQAAAAPPSTYNQQKRRSSGSISAASSVSSSGRSRSDSIPYGGDSAAGYVKPELSYAAIITEAIQSNHNQLMTLSEIYASIIERYPYFKTAPPGWKNSIRHNLSLHKSFARVARPSNVPGKGSFWKLATGGPEEIPKKTMMRSSRSESDPGITLTLGARSSGLSAITASGSGAGLFSHLSPNGKDEHHPVGGMHRASTGQPGIPHAGMFFYSPPSSTGTNAAAVAAAARRRAQSIMPTSGPTYLSPMPGSFYSAADMVGSSEYDGNASAMAYSISTASTPGSGNDAASQASSSSASYVGNGSGGGTGNGNGTGQSTWIPVYHPNTGQLMYTMSPQSNANNNNNSGGSGTNGASGEAGSASPQSWDPLYAIHQSSIRTHHLHPQPLDLSTSATIAEQQSRPAQVNEWLSTLPMRPATQMETGTSVNIVGTNSYGNALSPLHRHSITVTNQTPTQAQAQAQVQTGMDTSSMLSNHSSPYVVSYQPSKVATAAALQRRKSSLMMAMGNVGDNSAQDMAGNLMSPTAGCLTPDGSSSPQPGSLGPAAMYSSSPIGQGGMLSQPPLLTPSSSPVSLQHPPQAYGSAHEASGYFGMSPNEPTSSSPPGSMVVMTPTGATAAAPSSLETQFSNTPTYYNTGYLTAPAMYSTHDVTGQNANMNAKNVLSDAARRASDFYYYDQQQQQQQQQQVAGFAMDYSYNLSSASLLEHELLSNSQSPSSYIPQSIASGQGQHAVNMNAMNLQAAQAQGLPGSVYRQALHSSYLGDATAADSLEFVVDDKTPSMEWIYM